MENLKKQTFARELVSTGSNTTTTTTNTKKEEEEEENDEIISTCDFRLLGEHRVCHGASATRSNR